MVEIVKSQWAKMGRKGVSEEELENAKNNISGKWAFTRETNNQQACLYAHYGIQGLGFDFDDNIKQTFNTLDIQGRVPHAVVIESRDSEKAMSLAVFLSMYAVCTAPIKPCGSCEQCHKARNKAHADIKYVELPKDRKQNSIEQMREIIKDSIIKPNDSNAKVYIFPFADTRLSEIVQNSFLKLLEEPPQNVYFILLCENSKKLLTTILSRASVFRLKTKDVFSEDAVEGARKIIKGILSAKEYELIQAL